MKEKKMVRNGVLILAALAMALPLSACGKKGSPRHPEGTEFRQYPAPEEEKEQEGQAQPKKGAVGPGGFIYEYPNRPPSK